MQGHRRRRVTRKRVPRGLPQSPSARRVAAGRHRFLCRELDTVALATNTTISMKRGTKERERAEHSQGGWFRRHSIKFVHNPGWPWLAIYVSMIRATP